MTKQRPILITGGAGQLATALVEAAPRFDLPVQRVGRPHFDFEQPDTISEVFADTRPSLVVNAAAYTAVDAAEEDAAAALRANRDGPAELARLCRQADIPLIHVSTDYVYDGNKGAPYRETDATSPQGVYGASKLAGEQAALALCRRTIVLRTSWVYSPSGKNFVLTMLNAARRTDRLRVVSDQSGCPTSAADLAEVILGIAKRVSAGWEDHLAGTYHAAGGGETTWHGLAVAIFEEAARFGFRTPTVEPIATADWPTKARRPPDSRLDCSNLHATFGLSMPHWRESLSRTVEAILAPSDTAALQAAD